MIVSILSGSVTSDQLTDFLHGALRADFTSWSVKVGLVWYLMNGKVKAGLAAIRQDFTDHFAKIEKGFGDMVGEMKELKENVSKDLSTQTTALGGVRDDVSKLTIRVEKLETNKESTHG